MSCRHSFWSKPIEALISCITTEGPAAKRPPHCGLAASFRCFGVSLKGGLRVVLLIRRRAALAAGGTLAAALSRANRAPRNWTMPPRR